MEDTPTRLLTVKQVAARLSVSEDFVYKLMKSGRLRHYGVGTGQGGKRVSEEQLADYLRARERGSCPAIPAAPAPVPRRQRKLTHLS